MNRKGCASARGSFSSQLELLLFVIVWNRWKQCIFNLDAPHSHTIKVQCKAYSPVAPEAPCSSYKGTLDTCATFLGNSLKCYYVDTCTARLCTDVNSPSDNKACTDYLSTCRYFKGKCVNASACTSYTNTSGLSLPECQDVYDNTTSTALKCWWESGLNCTPRTCADCETHIPSGCIYGNGKCQEKTLSCGSFKADTGTPEQKLADCNAMVDKVDKKCAARTCDLVPSPKSITDCETYLKDTCYQYGSKCVTKGICRFYLKSDMDTTLMTIY